MTEKLQKVRWFVLTLLFVATTINYLDRGILAVLLPEIRKQLHIDATSYCFYLIAWLIVHTLMGNLEPIAAFEIGDSRFEIEKQKA